MDKWIILHKVHFRLCMLKRNAFSVVTVNRKCLVKTISKYTATSEQNLDGLAKLFEDLLVRSLEGSSSVD